MWFNILTGLSFRKTCKEVGLNWRTFNRWKFKFENNESLEDKKPEQSTKLNSPLNWEKEAVANFALENPELGYRRLTWEMIDKDIVYLSESTVYNILNEKDLLYRWKRPEKSNTRKPLPPIKPHERWHTDLMYIRVGDVWYFLISFVDAYSRYVVYWDLLPSMTAEEVSAAQEAALKLYPEEKPNIVSDRGSQYTSKEYKELIRKFELKHILCKVRHPQSNGLVERFNRSTRERLDEKYFKDYEQALNVLEEWIEEYNERRLHAGLEYLPPKEYFSGNPKCRIAERNFKLALAKEERMKHWKNKQDGLEINETKFSLKLTG